MKDSFPELLHYPVVARKKSGTWGVFCTACSDKENDYVYPCKFIGIANDWPPAELFEDNK